MSNNPIAQIITTGLSPEIVDAVDMIKAAFAASTNTNAAYAGAQSFAEAVERLRAIGA